MILYLHPSLTSYFKNDQPLFDQIMALRGECFRHQEGRLTQRVKLGKKYYFIKQHNGVGFREIIKNLLQGRLPIIGAQNEWKAIAALQSLHVAVPTIVGYGKRGINPATQESFIIMEELAPTKSLEEITDTWEAYPPTFAEKQQLIKEVARIASILHTNGINHRDFYICHFLLDNHHKIYLIDLHRAQIRSHVPMRWMIKDLAGLYFSSKDIGLTQRDLLRFIKYYRASRNQSLRDILSSESNYWKQVTNRGEALYREHQ